MINFENINNICIYNKEREISQIISNAKINVHRASTLNECEHKMECDCDYFFDHETVTFSEDDRLMFFVEIEYNRTKEIFVLDHIFISSDNSLRITHNNIKFRCTIQK